MNHDDTGATPSHQEGDAAARPAGSASQPVDGMEALLRESEYAFRSLRRGETVEGTIVRIDQDEVLVDVGMKSEGVIKSHELYTDTEDGPPLQIGDRILVYVLQPEGSEGHAILSLRRAQMERSWRDIEDLYHRGAIFDAPVVDHNKGGLIVDVKGVRGFVPVSQVLDLRNVTRQEGESEEVTQTLAAMVNRRLPLKIIEINRSRNRLILSERAAVQEQRTQRKDELLDQLEPGQIRRGVVSNLTSFGAFIDLGGADGLVHVSELSYNRVNHPSEILRVGQEIDVMVLSIDRETKKIALSLKRALPDPWTTVEQTYRVGEVVPATITKLAKFGAFAKVEEGLEGLIHLSELTDLPVQDASQVVREGQQVNVKIIHINSQKRRLGLSTRQAGEPQPLIQSFGEIDSRPDIDLEHRLTEDLVSRAAQDEVSVESGVATGETESHDSETAAPPAEARDEAPELAEAAVQHVTESEAPAVGAGAPSDESVEAASSAKSAGAADTSSLSSSPEDEPTPGEQPVAAAEIEPQSSNNSTEAPEAEAAGDTPSVSSEPQLPTDEEEHPRMAPAGRQGTA